MLVLLVLLVLRVLRVLLLLVLRRRLLLLLLLLLPGRHLAPRLLRCWRIDRLANEVRCGPRARKVKGGSGGEAQRASAMSSICIRGARWVTRTQRHCPQAKRRTPGRHQSRQSSPKLSALAE